MVALYMHKLFTSVHEYKGALIDNSHSLDKSQVYILFVDLGAMISKSCRTDLHFQ